jgi:hypothetical protein
MLRLVREGCVFMGTLDVDVKRCTQASCGDIGSHPGRTKADDIGVASDSDVLVVEEELGEIKMRGICDMTQDTDYDQRAYVARFHTGLRGFKGRRKGRTAHARHLSLIYFGPVRLTRHQSSEPSAL